MAISLTTRLVRLADHLGELRFRLQDAARSEVAHAIADALAEATRALIAGPAADIGTGRSRSAYDERSEWDETWGDTSDFSAASTKEEVAALKEPFHYEAALASALAIARWSLIRTGQPIAAIGLATAVLVVLLLARERLRPLMDVTTFMNELLSFPKRST